jgi:hypothetical protein
MSMRGSALVFGRVAIGGAIATLVLAACSQTPSDVTPRNLPIQQQWELQPGDSVLDFPVAAGLGDISIELDGGSVYAPFRGQVEPNIEDCVVFSSSEVPAYVFRLCGLDDPKLGALEQGDVIGKGKYIHIAALRKQPDGTWALVEPSNQLLEQLLTKP